jgi:hypothetical protein
MTMLCVVLGLGLRAQNCLRLAKWHTHEAHRIRRPLMIVSIQLLPGQEKSYFATIERAMILADLHAARATEYRRAAWRPWVLVQSGDLPTEDSTAK